jgi:hypothetical protein
VQATVRAYDPEIRAGSVLLDDGLELPFDATAVASTLRHLRPGQRVRIAVEGAGRHRRVAALTLATFPDLGTGGG